MATSPIYGWLEPDNTDLVKNGALAIRTLGNAIDTTMGTMTPKSIVDAKGDLIAATANDTPARLAVGANGETLVADSSTATGLRYQTNTASGKNAAYNSSFDIWQRGTTFTGTSPYYGADRFCFLRAGAAAGATWTRQSSGLTGFQYSVRAQRDSGNTNTNEIRVAGQSLESADSYRFAGKTITFSFYAKVGANYSGTSQNIQVYSGTGTNEQYWVGGFAGLATVINTPFTPTTSWQRFSATATVSASATEIAFGIGYGPSGTAGANDWMEVTGLQFEEGSVATAYARQTGTLQGETSACQRYYWRTSNPLVFSVHGTGLTLTSTDGYFSIPYPVTMRVSPTLVEGANLRILDNAATAYTVSSVINAQNSATAGYVQAFSTTMTAGRSGFLQNNNSTSGYIAFGAEL